MPSCGTRYTCPLTSTLGKTLCLGQTLAYSEMRVAITVLLSRYRVRFAAAEDALRVERDMGDHFTLAPGQMNLIFERR